MRDKTEIKKEKLRKVRASKSYRLVRTIRKVMDDWYLDPIVGLIPGIGDSLTSVLSLPYIYITLFKIKSLPLTMAVIYNTLIDWIIGIIPLGDFVDFFFKSYKRNSDLILGFVEENPIIMENVNRKAVYFGIMVGVLAILQIFTIILVNKGLQYIADVVATL